MTDRPIRIVGISGSLRKGSYNTALLHAGAELAPSDVRVEVAEIGDLPLYNWDLEHEGYPDGVVRFRDAVLAADGLLIATPEYNYSVTAALKNAIDWASRPPSPLDGLPAAMLGAGGRAGSLRSQLHLRDILVHNDLRVVTKPEVLVPSPSTVFEDGHLVHDRFRDQIRRLMLALRRTVIEARRLAPRTLVIAADAEVATIAARALAAERHRPLVATSVDHALGLIEQVPLDRVAVAADVAESEAARMLAAAAEFNIQPTDFPG